MYQGCTEYPPKKQMQRTKRGPNGASPLICVLAMCPDTCKLCTRVVPQTPTNDALKLTAPGVVRPVVERRRLTLCWADLRDASRKGE
jgi:hypothetical protein